ncbi:MAG: translation initiation factor [Salibacteraceae bacterium]
MAAKKKKRINVVYSTNPDYTYDDNEEATEETLPPAQQVLKMAMEKKGRGGKTATVIRGFVGQEDDLKALAKHLKTRLGVGGSASDGEVVIQGDLRPKVREILEKEGYRVKG